MYLDINDLKIWIQYCNTDYLVVAYCVVGAGWKRTPGLSVRPFVYVCVCVSAATLLLQYFRAVML